MLDLPSTDLSLPPEPSYPHESLSLDYAYVSSTNPVRFLITVQRLVFRFLVSLFFSGLSRYRCKHTVLDVGPPP